MYSLIVTARYDAWNGDPYKIPRSRIFEYTDKEFEEQFGLSNKEQRDRLIKLPTLFCYEYDIDEPARIGWVKKIIPGTSSGVVSIEYEFESSLPPIGHEQLHESIWDLDIEDLELHRTHWAVKDINLFSTLIDIGLVESSKITKVLEEKDIQLDTLSEMNIQVRPTVFQIPSESQEHDLVSVMMPFHPNFQDVYQTIQEICGERKLKCFNANEVWESGIIIQEIFSLLYRSKVVICDFSTKNANVFYEAGIAHTLGRAVIPIVQSDEDVPFDLKHHRYIKYLNNSEGLADLALKLAPRIESLIAR